MMSALLSGPMTQPDPLAVKFAAVLSAYGENNPQDFNEALMDYRCPAR